MTKRVNRLASVLTVGGLLACGATACRGTTAAKAGESGEQVLATIGGTPLTLAELEADASSRLFGLRTQEFELRERLTRELVAERLLRQEAKSRSLTVEELLAAEVDDQVRPPTEAEVAAQYEAVKARVANRPKEQVLRDIRAGLEQRRTAARRAAYVSELFERADVKIQLEPPRASISIEGQPVLGPATAPVTMVEFSDYQCPYCARAAATVAEVRERYGDKLRLVFRDLPLTRIHPKAAKAAEAAACAGDQGKFWEMNEALFANQDDLDPAGLKRRAAGLGLDAAAFAECLESGRKTAEVSKDAALAQELGITGTPAFFINGRLVKGAQPLEKFAEIIDDELERAATAKPARGRQTSAEE